MTPSVQPASAASDRAPRLRPRYSSTAGLIDASASCTRAARAGSASACASGCTSTWITNTAWCCPSTGMKLWRSVRHQASAANASPSRCRRPRRRVDAIGVGVQARVARDRPDEALPALAAGDQARQVRRRAGDQAVVGHRRVHLGERAADLVLGRPVRRQRDGQPRDRGVAAIDDREILGKGERQQRGATPRRGQRQQAFADLGPRRAAGCQLVHAARRHRQPSRGSARATLCRRARSARGCSRAAWCASACERRPRHRSRRATAAPAWQRPAAPRASRAGGRGAALGRDVGRQLRGAIGQPAQPRLHAKRRADGGVEVERHSPIMPRSRGRRGSSPRAKTKPAPGAG